MKIRLFARGFEFELIPSITSFLLFVLLLSLGNWQLNRAAEKERIERDFLAQSRVDEFSLNRLDLSKLKDFLYSRIFVDGHFLAEKQLLLDNRTHKGVAGFHVVSPFVLANTDQVILVNRGWIPLHGRDVKRMEISLDEQPRQVHGILKAVPGSFVLSGAEVSESFPRIVQKLDIPWVSEQLDLAVIPFMLEMNASEKDGFLREWKPYVTGKDKHKAYALQWFLMAGVLLVLFMMFSRDESATGSGLK